MIEISPAEFYRTHKGLVRLLNVVEQAGEEGISMRKLCQATLNSRHYCPELIDYATKAGYIKVEQKPPLGKGNWRNVHYITAEGRRLLKQIGESNSRRHNLKW